MRLRVLKVKLVKLAYKGNYINGFMLLDFDNDVITDVEQLQTTL